MNRMSLRRRWPVAVTIAVLALAIGAVLGSVRVGSAATMAKPTNQNPPTISGTPQVGSTLKASHGDWNQNGGGAISSYDYHWKRCGSDGGSCSDISGATSQTYTLKAVDEGNTLRVAVTAHNHDGKATATSVPTSVIKAAPAPTTTAAPTSVNGCPTAPGAVNVSQLSSPARLLVDGQSAAPSPIGRSTTDLTIRFHVSACGGRDVTGALVYATAIPYNQFSIPSETPTDSTGWATMTMHREGAFPASPRQQILAVFVRARKPGDPLLGGISTRRLVSFPVNLHG